MTKTTNIGNQEFPTPRVWPLDLFGTDVVQQFWGTSQTVGKALTELNAEVADFVGQRITHGGEAIGRMAQCRSLPEVFEAETQWLQTSLQDYSKEVSKLLDVNIKLVGSLVSPAG